MIYLADYARGQRDAGVEVTWHTMTFVARSADASGATSRTSDALARYGLVETRYPAPRYLAQVRATDAGITFCDEMAVTR